MNLSLPAPIRHSPACDVPSQPGLRFLHRPSGELADSIWRELRLHGLWHQADFGVHEGNTLKGAGDRSDWRPIFTDWFPVDTGQTWCARTERALDPVHFPNANGEGALEDFLDAAKSFFARFDGRRIGVQLSGGFDSSLIIGLLRHFGIPHGLVGLESARYEFRTERTIQHRLAEQNGDVILIDEGTCLPCSRLREVPTHQVPDLLSLNLAQDRDMATACRQLGIEVLLSGGGGDNLLGMAVPKEAAESRWRPQTFTDSFPVDLVYDPLGIEFLSFFSDAGIVDASFRLRRGQGNDNTKRWARGFFRDFLPRELAEYTYCADFWGRSIDGLLAALGPVRELHAEARDLSGSAYFGAERLERLLSEDLFRPRKDLYQRIEARISAAVWVVSVAKWIRVADSSPQQQRDESKPVATQRK
jgi:hypothetical protein